MNHIAASTSVPNIRCSNYLCGCREFLEEESGYVPPSDLGCVPDSAAGRAVQGSGSDAPATVVPTEEDHDESVEDMSKPVAVKSILKNLKPSESRYSFAHNRDEF